MLKKPAFLFGVVLLAMGAIAIGDCRRAGAAADDPAADFTPDKYFLHKLKNPNASDLEQWDRAYAEHFYRAAEAKKFSGVSDYAPYVALAPASPHLTAIYDKVFKKGQNLFGFERSATFAFFEEYRRRFPAGKYVDQLPPKKILKNELAVLKKVYASQPFERVIEAARKAGATAEDLSDIQALKKEVGTFEKLDIRSESACLAFIEDHPDSPRVEMIREFHFTEMYADYLATPAPSALDQLVLWLPRKEAGRFYTALWDRLQQDAEAKGAAERLKVLDPLLLTTNYKLNTLDEIIFLTDLLSSASYVHLELKETGRFAFTNLVASAVLHEAHEPMKGSLIGVLNDLLGGGMKNFQDMQKKMAEAKANLSKGVNNIRSGQQMLHLLGVAGYFFGSIDFIQQIVKNESMNKAEKQAAFEAAKEGGRRVMNKDDPYTQNLHRLLSKILSIDPDSWPSLQALIVSPDKRQIEKVALMPRFYDYSRNMDEYLTHFASEAASLALTWLQDPRATAFKKARALYILGLLEKKIPATIAVDRSDLDTHAYFLDYYLLRTGAGTPANREALARAAAGENRVALVLYTKVQGKAPIPEGIRAWLEKKIDNKKYQENEAIHIFNPVVENAAEADKSILIDRMFNSYNIEWADVAAGHFQKTLDPGISSREIEDVLQGGIPFKKLALVKHLIAQDKESHRPYIRGYLSGEYDTAADKELLERNLKNKLTKDLVVGYNQSINWSVVNQAVAKMESRVRAVSILQAKAGLDRLDFSEALAVIRKRFLPDEHLCVEGARWILTHHDPATHPALDFSEPGSGPGDVAQAVALFLRASYSPERDFAPYLAAVEKLKENDAWLKLITLKTQFVEKAGTRAPEMALELTNPVQDRYLDTLMRNIKNRLQLRLQTARPAA